MEAMLQLVGEEGDSKSWNAPVPLHFLDVLRAIRARHIRDPVTTGKCRLE